MPSDIRNRFEQAIRDEDEKSLGRLRASRESTRLTEERFVPVRQAAEELREQIQPAPSIEFTVNPDSVWIALGDRDLRFTYDADLLKFTCEEGAHSWYDGEPYSDRYEWDDADACIDAMIRLCAKYVRMARAISAASAQS